MRVVIIDSGTNNRLAEGIHFFYNGNEIEYNNDVKDSVGHGTAVHNIISKHNENVECFIVKIFNSEDDVVDEKLLIYALEYIYNNIECSFINLSMGIRICDNEIRMKNICDKFNKKGIVLISAFDNEGSVSYPAFFEDVIGVLSSERCIMPEQIVSIDNSSILNVLAYGGLQRVKWLNGKYNMVQGNSFACAHVTGILSNIAIHDHKLSFKKAIEYLRDQSMDILKLNARECIDRYNVSFNIKINHAAVFPFNKEIHSLILFQDLLDFEIDEVYDTKYSLNVGAQTDNVLKKKCKKNFIIKNITYIQWQSIDTLIIGHIGKILQITQKRDYIRKILQEANDSGRLLYAFDDLQEMFPEIKFNNLFSVRKLDKDRRVMMPNGMLFHASLPVLEVCGTSSQQGKYTLQLLLRRLFLKHGYKVGQLGTEPSALLFGMDEIFHFGYDNDITLNSYQVTALLNFKMHEIEKKAPDIIITGSQGNVLMDNASNLQYYTFSQTEFLLGTLPDAILLCVNTFDDISEIIRKITYLESVICTKVIAIVIFPTKIVSDIIGNPKIADLDKNEYENTKKYFRDKTFRDVFLLGDESDMKELFNIIVEFYSATDRETFGSF